MYALVRNVDSAIVFRSDFWNLICAIKDDNDKHDDDFPSWHPAKKLALGYRLVWID